MLTLTDHVVRAIFATAHPEDVIGSDDYGHSLCYWNGNPVELGSIISECVSEDPDWTTEDIRVARAALGAPAILVWSSDGHMAITPWNAADWTAEMVAWGKWNREDDN